MSSMKNLFKYSFYVYLVNAFSYRLFKRFPDNEFRIMVINNNLDSSLKFFLTYEIQLLIIFVSWLLGNLFFYFTFINVPIITFAILYRFFEYKTQFKKLI